MDHLWFIDTELVQKRDKVFPPVDKLPQGNSNCKVPERASDSPAQDTAASLIAVLTA
jgi:hypothetical protein